MRRRRFPAAVVHATLLAACGVARAQTIASLLSTSDATQGVKAALERGASAAVDLLGRTNGFLGNPKVRIPLPGWLKDAEKLAKTFGQGKRFQELVTSMNRAAEQAVPAAKQLLMDAVRTMSVTDARAILTGGDTSVTKFFADKTRAPLAERFLPIVSDATRNVGLAAQYNKLASTVSSFGVGTKEDASIEHYVTRKALDGLYLMIGEEERAIRRDPVGTGSALLQKVFGSLK